MQPELQQRQRGHHSATQQAKNQEEQKSLRGLQSSIDVAGFCHRRGLYGVLKPSWSVLAAASPRFHWFRLGFHRWSVHVVVLPAGAAAASQSACLSEFDGSLHQTQNLLHSSHFNCICMTRNILYHISVARLITVVLVVCKQDTIKRFLLFRSIFVRITLVLIDVVIEVLTWCQIEI